MKHFYLITLFVVISASTAMGQVGISADNSAPDNSAMLDVKSTTKGFLPPRIALTAANVASPITSPAIGLFVYNTATSGTSPNNVVPGYYCWNGTLWIAVITPQGTHLGDMLYWNGTQWVGIPAGSNGQTLTLTNGVPTWMKHTSPCGFTLTINHVAGVVAPVDKTVTYGTVTSIPGEPSKCWLTSNLGASHQATAANDATEASAGWYFQFNRKQGYQYISSRIPATPWITSISETSDWIDTNDPCTLELGAGWRIPTSSEWTNADAGGNWNDWNGPWYSALKMHVAGYLYFSNGVVVARGSDGHYWSSSQIADTGGSELFFTSGVCNMNGSLKTFGFSIRCLRDL